MSAKTDRLGTMPVGRLIAVMSIPMMLSFFIQALYNIVDSIFVAQISEDALAAVSLAFPVQMIITALGVGNGIAINALVPRFNGKNDKENAEKIVNIAFLFSLIFSLIFCVLGLTLVRPFFMIQTDDTIIVQMGVDYLSVVCMVSIGAFTCQVFEKMLTATGNSLQSMLAQGAGAVINIVFDPLLIFGIGPFPMLGVTGAAIATVFGQIFSAVLAFLLLKRKEKNIHFSIRKMKPKIELVKLILSVSFPATISAGVIGSLMSFLMNQVLLSFSTTATAVFGIWLKLQNFSYMPIYGMNNGTMPIIAYNYGAGNIDRVRETIKKALFFAIILTAALTVVFECIPVQLLWLFNASDNMLSIGTAALRICVLGLAPGAFCIIMSSVFQTTGYNRYTLIQNVCRQLVFIIPIAFILSFAKSAVLVFICVPAAEVLAVFLTIRLRKTVFEKLGL